MLLTKIDWLIIILIVGILAFILGAAINDSRSPTFALKKSEWACTNAQPTPETTFVLVGKIMVPVTSVRNDCSQWSRRP